MKKKYKEERQFWEKFKKITKQNVRKAKAKAKFSTNSILKK